MRSAKPISYAGLKRQYELAIRGGVAQALWRNAWIGFSDKYAYCEYCGELIWRATEADENASNEGEWIDASDDGRECEQSADGHMPSSDWWIYPDAGPGYMRVPPAPHAAHKAADDFAKLMANSEGMTTKTPLADLYEIAMTFDQGEFQFEHDPGGDLAAARDMPPEIDRAALFGNALVHMAMGTGRSWFADHRQVSGDNRLELLVPHFAIQFNGKELSWEGRERTGGPPRADRAPLVRDARSDITYPRDEKIGDVVIHDESALQNPRFLLALGIGILSTPRRILVGASSVEDALDAAVDWLAANEPGLLATDEVDEEFDRLRSEKERELGRKLDNSRDRKILDKIAEKARVDTYEASDGNSIMSDSWTILAESPTDDELRDIAYHRNPSQWFEVEWPGGKARYPSSYLAKALARIEQSGVPRARIKVKAVRANPGEVQQRSLRDDIERCSRCDRPAHASETNDRGVCRLCAKAKKNSGEIHTDLQEGRVRRILASRGEDEFCSEDCSGWDVFDTDRGLRIQACDDCNRRARELRRPTVTDDDVALLWEAQNRLDEARRI